MYAAVMFTRIDSGAGGRGSGEGFILSKASVGQRTSFNRYMRLVCRHAALCIIQSCIAALLTA